MSQSRFLVLHPDLGQQGGGVKVCYNVIRALVNHGQHVELLTQNFDPSRYCDATGEEFPSNIQTHIVNERTKVNSPFVAYKKHHVVAKMLKQFKGSLEYDFLFDTQANSPFAPLFLDSAKKNVAYVHFPDVHYNYYHSNIMKRFYLWPFKRWVEQGIAKLDVVLCNSNYTKGMIERYWGGLGIRDPILVYPPVRLSIFWCNEPLRTRRKRVVYDGRFIPSKRHDLMKRLATDLPMYEFVSLGGLTDSEEEWFDVFSRDLPKNYTLRVNQTGEEIATVLQDSRVYVHLTRESFGIAPIEAIASGCVPIVYNSGGAIEFVPEEFRWRDYEGLRKKVMEYMESDEESIGWESRRKQLWGMISNLDNDRFQSEIWSHVEGILK